MATPFAGAACVLDAVTVSPPTRKFNALNCRLPNAMGDARSSAAKSS